MSDVLFAFLWIFFWGGTAFDIYTTRLGVAAGAIESDRILATAQGRPRYWLRLLLATIAFYAILRLHMGGFEMWSMIGLLGGGGVGVGAGFWNLSVRRRLLKARAKSALVVGSKNG
jgi:hypothetical protein